MAKSAYCNFESEYCSYWFQICFAVVRYNSHRSRQVDPAHRRNEINEGYLVLPEWRRWGWNKKRAQASCSSSRQWFSCQKDGGYKGPSQSIPESCPRRSPSNCRNTIDRTPKGTTRQIAGRGVTALFRRRFWDWSSRREDVEKVPEFQRWSCVTARRGQA